MLKDATAISEFLEACDWPTDLTFQFRDEPGEHDPCYVIMPGGAMLPLAHHNRNGVDQARAQFIVAACNAAISALQLIGDRKVSKLQAEDYLAGYLAGSCAALQILGGR